MLAPTRRRLLARSQPRTAPSRATRHSRPLATSTSPSSRGPAPAPAPAELLADLRRLLDRYPLVDPAWTARLDRAADDLARQRPARVAVVGGTHAQHLVTALLDDPLASNQDCAVALEARRLAPDSPQALVLKHGTEVRASPGELHLPSNWLRDIDAEVVEVVHRDVVPLESSFSAIHLADLVVLVLSDSTILSSKPAQALLYNLATKPNLILALDTPDASPSASASSLRALEHQLASVLPTAHSTPRTLAVSTSQALSALEALSPSEPDQKPAYDAFQKGYLASRIPHLHQLLTLALTSTHAGLPAPTPLQLQTAAYVLSAALARAAFAGAQVADSLDEADAALAALDEHASEAKRALLAALGVEAATGLLRIPADEQRAAGAALDELFATRLAWYKLPYRVDDLGAEIALVASQTFLPAFERRLAFAAGLAASTTASLSLRVDALFASPLFAAPAAPSPTQQRASLYSATVLNALAQAAAASQAPDDHALSGAVAARRAQISAPGGPASMLHARAQRAVARAGTLALASVGAAGAADALGWVAQTGTSVGVGLLGLTVSAWALQRAWLAALARFRQDVQRVLGGVEEDLGVRAARVADRAAWKATVAVRLGRDKVREKRGEWDEARRALAALDKRRRALLGDDDAGTGRAPRVEA